MAAQPAVSAVLEQLEQRHGVRAADGVQLLSADALVRRPFDPGWPLVIVAGEPRSDATVDRFAVLPGRHARSARPLEILCALYPPDHPVLSVDGGAHLSLGELTDADLARGTWLLPPLVGEQDLASPHALPWLVARLRAPDGCPWDREQTHQSLRKHLLEESHEVYDALEQDPGPELAEELGDLLLQIVLHAQFAAERGVFDLTDVYRAVMSKIIRRHPHVFGDVEASSVEQVVRNWEQIKERERAERSSNGHAPGHPGPEGAAEPQGAAAFSGLSRSLPALAYAQEMQERAASLGYDWPDLEGVIDKLEEEAVELLEAPDDASRREEYGDLLLVIVNLGRKLGIDSEAALRSASAKFSRRFARVEALAEERGVALGGLDLAGLDELWETAKRGGSMPA